MSNPMITVNKEMDCSVCSECSECGDCWGPTNPFQLAAGSAGLIVTHYFG